MRLPSVGVIGAGERGMRLIKICAAYGALGAVSDTAPERLRKACGGLPAVSALLEPHAIFEMDVDAVAIATPAHTHVGFALEALASGKHVFVDKPLALSEEGASAVALKAERAGRSVFVGHELLYHPAIVEQRKLIESGTLGEIIHVRARRLTPGAIRTDEDVWWRLAPDDMAYIVSLFGEPTSVAASQQSRASGELADIVYADVQFGDKRSAHIEVTWLDPHDGSRVDIFGTRGVASVETAGVTPQLSVHLYRRDDPRQSIGFEPPTIRTFSDTDPLENAVLAFLESLRGKSAPISNVAHGVATARALAAITRAGAYQTGEFVVPGSRQYVFAAKNQSGIAAGPQIHV